jgi:hypothetical protein
MTTQGINMCLYADNGTGKTSLITSEPRTLVLQADPGGTTTAASLGRTGRYKIITKWTDLEDTEEYFRNGPGTKKFGWVWLDSISLFQDIGLEDIMVNLIKPAAQGGKGRSHREVFHPDKGEYGENMNRIKLFVRHMCGMPINFGFTAFPFRTEDEQSGEVQYLPWVQGKGMPNALCGMVDVIGYMKIVQRDGQDRQAVYFKKKDMYYAKDRFGALPAAMLDPTIPKIEGLIKARLASQNKTNGAHPVKRVAKKAAARRA